MEKKTIHDKELGEVVYDSSMDWYEATITTSYGLINVSLGCEEYESEKSLINDMRMFCHELDQILKQAFANILKTMVPLKNECWLDEDENPITESDLLGAIQSEEISISLSKGGLAEMFFGDGDFFGGHSIVVWRHEDGTVDGAHLAG